MPLRVIGAGLGRTGTLSLKQALEQLGFGPCYHMVEVIPEPARVEHWHRVIAGEPDWDAVFDGYAACVDYPACTWWRELAAHYRDAKIVLSVRSPESWFESTQQTILSPLVRELTQDSPLDPIIRAAIIDTIDGAIDDREAMIRHFEQHVETVRRDAPADRLLVFDVREGWEPLCRFLGVPVPDTPFPRVNSRDEFGGTLEAARNAGLNP